MCVYFTLIVHVFICRLFKMSNTRSTFLKSLEFKGTKRIHNEHLLLVFHLNILTKQLKEMFQYTFIIN